jgi:hypothetical protein
VLRRPLRRLLPAVAATALLLAGCGGDQPPQVTFAVGETSVDARPTQYCDIALTDCKGDPTAPVELPVPPGTAVQITVPDEIAQSPWQVVYSYRDGAGTQTDERSSVFAPSERSLWTLQLPGPTDRLLTAQVQQYGPPPQINPETGEVEFPIRASWVLNAGA